MAGAAVKTAQWLAFLRLPGASRRERLELLDRLGSLEAVYGARRPQLEQYLPDRGEAIRAILAGPDEQALKAELDWLADERHHLVAWEDADYPRLLREIPDPPLALYAIGRRDLLSQAQLAIVGSRNASAAGRENAHAFAGHLASAGFAITSGLALGIDGAAHRGALEGGGATLAVVATGLDRVYPARHRELAHEIARRGALVSEFPFGTPPLPENFPIRNRLISGLALGVLVVEAAVTSGSLITARLATEQGREVFAIPGSIHSPLTHGCHRLIRDGAKLVETAQDILEELGSLARVTQAATPAARRVLAPELASLLAHLGHDPAGVDALIERSGLTAEAVSSMLLRLELEGLVEACPGGRYQRVS